MNLITFATAFVCLTALPLDLGAQGKGKGGGKEDGQTKATDHEARKAGNDQAKEKSSRGYDNQGEKSARGRSNGNDNNGNDNKAGARGIERRSDRANDVAAGPKPSGKPARSQFLSAKEVKRFNLDLRNDQVNPRVRTFLGSSRHSDLIAGGALAYAMARGLSPADLLFGRTSDLVELKNRRGNVLFAIRDDHARSLGSWRVSPLNDEIGEGAPSFCRSGAGHPVWGRQWCIDKGFGLGASGDTRWGRTRDVSDIRWNGDYATGSLTRDALIAVLGETTFNRLALHAVTLGLVDPLAGQWRTDASGQRLLLVSSARTPVAEIADFNNDRIADLMLVALRGW